MLDWLKGVWGGGRSPGPYRVEVVASLEQALVAAQAETRAERHEKLVFLGAVAMQAGGEFLLPMPFLDTVSDGDYRLTIRTEDDKSAVRVTLTEGPAPKEDEE